VKGLGFPKHERLDKRGPSAPGKPLLYPLGKPQIMLLIQLVVIAFKHSVKGLGFPKYERLDEKASRKKHLEKSISKKASRKKHLEKSISKKALPKRQPLLYPLEKPQITLLELLVVIVFKYSVKGLGFPKCKRLDKGGPKAPDKPLLYPLEKNTSLNFPK
jgi:hypothetical protein